MVMGAQYQGHHFLTDQEDDDENLLQTELASWQAHLTKILFLDLIIQCIRAIISSVMDTSAPCFYLWSPNCKYLQLLSFMAVQDKFGLCFGQTIEA